MTANGWFQIGLYLILLLAITKPMGVYMTRVFSGEKTFMDPVLRPVERLLYRLTGVDETHEMRWTEYAIAMLLLSVVSMVLLYVIMRVQQWLPWNPQHFGAVAPDSAFNTAASFTTNTNWQAYSGETTMSYFTQMAGLAYHNFLSAAVGIALAIAVIRGSRAQGNANHRKFLGGFDPDDFVGAVAGVHRGGAFSCFAGDGAEPEAVHYGKAGGSSNRAGDRQRWKNDHTACNRAIDYARASGFAGSNQNVRHKRRRLFQR